MNVHYFLSAEGQKSALIRGLPSSEHQTIEVSLDMALAHDLLTVTQAGYPEILIGCRRAWFDREGKEIDSLTAVVLGTKPVFAPLQQIVGYRQPGLHETHPQVLAVYGAIKFDEPMDAKAIMAWKKKFASDLDARTAEVTQICRENLDRKTAQENANRAARQQAQKTSAEAWIEGLREGHKDDPAVALLIQQIDTEYTEHNLARAMRAIEVRRKKDLKQEALEERSLWIATHGSVHLQRLVREQWGHEETYKKERLSMEAPGWAFSREGEEDGEEPEDPTPEALVFFDTAREARPHALLTMFRGLPDVGGGFGAVDTFLGERIVRFMSSSPVALVPQAPDRTRNHGGTEERSLRGEGIVGSGAVVLTGTSRNFLAALERAFTWSLGDLEDGGVFDGLRDEGDLDEEGLPEKIRVDVGLKFQRILEGEDGIFEQIVADDETLG